MLQLVGTSHQALPGVPVTFSLPGWVPGDLLILGQGKNMADPSAGWTPIGTPGTYSSAYWRIYDGEAGFTINYAGSLETSNQYALLMGVRGHDPVVPIGDYGYQVVSVDTPDSVLACVYGPSLDLDTCAGMTPRVLGTTGLPIEVGLFTQGNVPVGLQVRRVETSWPSDVSPDGVLFVINPGIVTPDGSGSSLVGSEPAGSQPTGSLPAGGDFGGGAGTGYRIKLRYTGRAA